MTTTTARHLSGWGRTMRTLTNVSRPNSVDEAVLLVRSASANSRAGWHADAARGFTARGLGRSYGDAAQNSGGFTIDLTGLSRVLSVDATADPPTVVVVEAGVSLEHLMRVLLLVGLWIPVLPGARQEQHNIRPKWHQWYREQPKRSEP